MDIGCLKEMNSGRLSKSLLALAAALVLLPAGHSLAQQPRAPAADPATAAGDIADFFSQVGDQIYEDCIFELSQEQLEVQQSLIAAYIKQGATSALARQLAVKQIQPPKLSDKCRQIKGQAKATPPPQAIPQPAAKSPAARATLPKIPSASHHQQHILQTGKYCRNGTARRTSTTSRFNTKAMREN